MKKRITIIILIVLVMISLYPIPVAYLEPLSDINSQGLEEKEDIDGRDPFLLPVEKETAPERERTESMDKGSEIKISGIIYGRNGGVAIIEDKILRKGDIFNEIRIIEVLKDRVIINDRDGKQMELRINRFKIKQKDKDDE